MTIGQGPPALLIHCSLARHEVLLPLAGLLPQRITLFDLPGHGRSPDWDGVTEYQTQSVEIAAALAAPAAQIIGHSFGATVALRLACLRPDLVSRLTLIEPVFFAAALGTPAFDAHVAAFRPFFSAIGAGDRTTAAQVFLGMWGQGQWADISPRAQSYVIDRIHLIAAAAGAIDDDCHGLLTSGLIERLAMPVTLIAGEHSPPVIAAIHAALAGRIPQASCVLIPGAGHMAPVTRPELVAKAMA